MAYDTAPDGSFHSEMPFENVHGNGGLLTTVGDLLLWNESFVHGKVGGPALIQALERPYRLNGGREIEYASGLYRRTWKGVPEVSHSGSTAGYRAFLARYPEQRLSVVVLCNLEDIEAPDLARRAAEIFLAGRLRPEAPGMLGSTSAMRPRSPTRSWWRRGSSSCGRVRTSPMGSRHSMQMAS